MTETISGVRIIKYFGWENMVIKTMGRIRLLESHIILQQAKLRGNTNNIKNDKNIFKINLKLKIINHSFEFSLYN